MSKQDFIEGFKFGVAFGRFRTRPEEIDAQAEYEWELYSDSNLPDTREEWLQRMKEQEE